YLSLRSRCQAHLARRTNPLMSATAPNTRLSATNVRAKGPNGGTGFPRRRLTVKLRGRPEAANQAPRAHNLARARGADIQTVHGPLQRLLDGAISWRCSPTPGPPWPQFPTKWPQ